MNDPDATYRRESGSVLVEIQLRNLDQLYNTLDPSPFHEKDLDSDAETFIVDTLNDIPIRDPVKLVIYLPFNDAARANPSNIANGIHHYFTFKISEESRRVRRVFRQGRLALIVGLSCLAAGVSGGEIAAIALPDVFWSRMLREGLLISGWVAMWKPFDIFLYAWWPQRHMIRIYRKLSQIPVEVRVAPAAE